MYIVIGKLYPKKQKWPSLSALLLAQLAEYLHSQSRAEKIQTIV